MVRKRLGRSDGDRIAGVHAHRVDIFDGANNHAVVGVITHDFEFVFFPTSDRGFDQDLGDRARLEAVGGDLFELFHRRCNAGSASAQDVGRTNNRWESDSSDHRHGLFEVVR
ncbi:unannotated protein [freshwater metagenome]|uniref:Unannotated protein n=1 Tax=freshwater metagenome TaxID=449393 RepID=A0A6J5ZNJ7_9ZZZZ